MSVKLMGYVWDTEISPLATRMVMLAIADSASDEGCCWPAMSTIARKSGVAVSTARESVARLEEDGYLRREIRPISGDRNESNRYWIDVDKLRSAAGEGREVPPDSGGSATGERRGNRNLNRKKEPKDANSAAAPSGPTDQPVLVQAGSEQEPAADEKIKNQPDLATQLMDTYREIWDASIYGPPVNADVTERWVCSIVDRFDCDPEALELAVRMAAERGKVSPAPAYAPAPLSGARATRAAQGIATIVYEEQDKQINFMAVRQVVKSAMVDGHQEPDDVLAGLRALFAAGKPPTKQVLAQFAGAARTKRLAEANTRGRVER